MAWCIRCGQQVADLDGPVLSVNFTEHLTDDRKIAAEGVVIAGRWWYATRIASTGFAC